MDVYLRGCDRQDKQLPLLCIFYVSVLITCPTFAFYSNTLPPFARGSAMEPLRARSTQLPRPKRESAAAASGDKAAEDRASGPAKQNRCHYITVRIPKT